MRIVQGGVDDVTVPVVTVMATWGATLGPEAGRCRVPCRHLHPSCGAHSCSCSWCSSKVQSGAAAEAVNQCHVGQKLQLSLGCLFTVCTTFQQSNAAGSPDSTTGISIPIANCDHCLEFRMKFFCFKLRSHANFSRDHGTNIECT